MICYDLVAFFCFYRYVRSLFYFDDFADCVPINAANLSIIFHPVQECMNAMASQWNRDISIQKRRTPFVYTIQTARALIASQLNAAPEDIAILRNGSDPNAVINNGLDYNPGDNIVLFDQNHPTNSADTAFAIRKLRFPNITCRTVSLTGLTDPSKQTIIDAFLGKVLLYIIILLSVRPIEIYTKPGQAFERPL